MINIRSQVWILISTTFSQKIVKRSGMEVILIRTRTLVTYMYKYRQIYISEFGCCEKRYKAFKFGERGKNRIEMNMVNQIQKACWNNQSLFYYSNVKRFIRASFWSWL